MEFEGSHVQSAIYTAGEPPGPVAFEDWERLAAERLEPHAYAYIAGGAGGERTMAANLEAFERRRLRPRMLRGTRARDLSVEILGVRLPAPVLLAPVGVLTLAHPEGELAAARAGASLGLTYILSSAATHSIEQVADAMGESPRWFQLYWSSDEEIARSFVERASAAGYGAIVVTVDTLNLGWRPRDLRNAYLPFLSGEGLGQWFSDPVFRTRLSTPPEEDVLTAAATALSLFSNLGLTWDDLPRLREWTTLPILVKGVLTADDAVRAFETGIDGVIVSNHGGRQVDGAVAALDALVEVRGRVGRERTVLMDSGIRTGADVVKALALGADAVLVGRPYAYGLAVDGQRGVETVLRNLLAETDLTCALAGVRSVAELDPSWVDG